MSPQKKKLFGLGILVATAILTFSLFSVLGLDGVSIAAPSASLLLKLSALLLPMLTGLWCGLAFSVNARTATQIVMFLLAFMLASLSIGYLRFG